METDGLPFGEVVRDVAGDDGLHHPHARGGRPRPVSRAARRGAPGQDPRGACTSRTKTSWGWAGSIRATLTSPSA